jgi:hypothetical protein
VPPKWEFLWFALLTALAVGVFVLPPLFVLGPPPRSAFGPAAMGTSTTSAPEADGAPAVLVQQSPTTVPIVTTTTTASSPTRPLSGEVAPTPPIGQRGVGRSSREVLALVEKRIPRSAIEPAPTAESPTDRFFGIARDNSATVELVGPSANLTRVNVTVFLAYSSVVRRQNEVATMTAALDDLLFMGEFVNGVTGDSLCRSRVIPYITAAIGGLGSDTFSAGASQHFRCGSDDVKAWVGKAVLPAVEITIVPGA